MDSDYEYRKYKPGDEAGILALLQKTFTKWSKRTVDYWRWKYLDSPLDPRVYVALNGGKIIGAFCEIPISIKLGDEIVGGVYGDDTATDPDYRGRGIYTNLNQFFIDDIIKDGVYFSTWATENPILIKTYSRKGSLPFPFRLCRMIKIKNLNEYLKGSGRDTLTNVLGYHFLKGVNSLTSFPTSLSKTKHDYSIDGVNEFDEAIDSFWNQVKKDYNFILEKKKDYLNWRYRGHDRDQYYIRVAAKGGTVLGFSVLRYDATESGSEGSIMDLLALRDRLDVSASLIDDALSLFESMGANSVYCQTIYDHPYRSLYAKRGFVDVTRASRSRLYYNFHDKPGFDPEVFSDYSPKSIYFNYY